MQFEAGFMSASFTKKPVNLQKYIRKLTKFCWKDLKLLRMYVKVEKWITYHQNSGKHPEKCLKTFSALEDALLSHFYNYAKKQTFMKSLYLFIVSLGKDPLLKHETQIVVFYLWFFLKLCFSKSLSQKSPPEIQF